MVNITRTMFCGLAFSTLGIATKYPTREEVVTMFRTLEDPTTNGTEFFSNHVEEDVRWEVTGANPYSIIYENRDGIFQAWQNLVSRMQPPGLAFEIPEAQYGQGAVIVGSDGWASVQLRSVDTFTLDGSRYDQAYCYLVQFNEQSRIQRAVAYLDSWVLNELFPSS